MRYSADGLFVLNSEAAVVAANGISQDLFGYAPAEIMGNPIEDYLSERAYGLLLSDVHMPNMDGFELTKAIRDKEDEYGTRLPVVAISANALQGEGERCLEMGMDGFLPKPMDLKELRECLETWLPGGHNCERCRS